jgi:hypothetical protein
MSAHNQTTLIKQTSLNVYAADIFNCSRHFPEPLRASLHPFQAARHWPDARETAMRNNSLIAHRREGE